MEISSAISDAFPASHGKLPLLPRLSISLPASPVAVRSDPSRHARAPRALTGRTRRRTRRRSITDGGGGDDDDGPFGGGGSGGRGWNSGDSTPGWDGPGDSSWSPDPAFDFIYEVICWIALSNCAHFAFKKVGRLLATREKALPLRLLSSMC